MEYNLEKSIKRYLKRKIKITLGFIVAFLLSCSFVMADTAQMGVFIGQDENGKIVIEDNYSENSFENGIYTNNSIIAETPLETGGITGNFGIFTYFEKENNIPLSIVNNGSIDILSNDVDAAGIYNWAYSDTGANSKIGNIENKGNITAISEKGEGYGIYNSAFFSTLNIDKIINDGRITASSMGIYNEVTYPPYSYLKISSIENTGIILGGYNGINNYYLQDEEIKPDIINSGIISGKGSRIVKGIVFYSSLTGNIINAGIISGITSGEEEGIYTLTASGIESGGYPVSSIDNIFNNGVIFGHGTGERVLNGQNISFSVGEGISNRGIINQEIKNNGIIYGYGNMETPDSEKRIGGYGIYNTDTIEKLSNKGIIFGKTSAVFNEGKVENYKGIKSFENFGLLVNREMILNGQYTEVVSGTDVTNYGLMFTAKDDGTYEIKGQISNNDNVINAKLKSDSKGTESISADNYSGKYINGITDTLKVDKDAEILNSVINGYTNAVVFAEGGHSLTLTGTTVNGGVSNISDTENSLGTAILGSISGDKLTFVSSSEENKTVINGNIDLGAGDDMLTINNTVQINGNIDGGTGRETEIGDTLIFGSSSAKSSETENMNILYNISGFENINVDNKITLFENIKVTDVKNITIGESGEVVLRIDGTNNNSHALLGNTGTVSSSGGKLLLALNGVGEGATIEFGDMILGESIKGNEIGYAEDITLDTTSLLHSLAKGENNTVTVKTVENLPETDIPENVNYDKLNKIYQSIRSVDKVGEFNIDDDKKLTAFTKYLNDIYAGNPYAYSSELSRKTMGMMRNLVDKDLKPELNKWAVYGGFTHIDGGTENSYYGKGYYTYDIGSRDIKADTKITGGYFKAEFGKSQDITTGIIFGGNNSETEIGASNVEGDSFYFGAYAKKYLNNFRFTLGAGFQHGDYKGERTAVGYEGITETKKYDSNYHDRGFDIYGNIKYSKELGNNFFFEPSFTLSYTYLDQDGAKDEKGTFATETDSQYFDYSSGEVNFDLRKSFAGEKLTHSLTAGVSYERMLSGYDEEYITGRIKGGTDFDILVPEKEKDIFSLNAKYELETEKGILFDVKGSYRFEHDTDQNEWTVGTGIGYKF